MVPLRSDTIQLVKNGCSFYGLRSEDPKQHLKDFLKFVDSLDLDGENRERTRLLVPMTLGIAWKISIKPLLNTHPRLPMKRELNIGLLEETDHIFRLADGTKSYPVRIVKDVKVHIGKLKTLNDFYVIDIKKDPETLLLVGRGFLATTNAIIDGMMAKIAVVEGITMSVFRVKGVDLGEEEAPY
nr:MAK10-like protein [Tanacetum cinerariifolium]